MSKNYRVDFEYIDMSETQQTSQTSAQEATHFRFNAGYAKYIVDHSHYERYLDISPYENSRYGKRHVVFNTVLYLFSCFWVTAWCNYFWGDTSVDFILNSFAVMYPIVTFFPSMYYLFKPYEAPLRFHRGHQKLYVHHKRRVYAIPTEAIQFETQDTTYSISTSLSGAGDRYGPACYLKMILEPRYIESSSRRSGRIRKVRIAYEKGVRSKSLVREYSRMLEQYMKDPSVGQNVHERMLNIKKMQAEKPCLHRDQTHLCWVWVAGIFAFLIPATLTVLLLPHSLTKWILDLFQNKLTPQRRLPEWCD